ncbi:SDR family oxidoreductase [Dactylosporangium sp. AC04546]|uniref:SDR family NAD(P)-dependent oxidoreductase n=1 Tax=Dactylosporangium sp. AC04546 TaxID=2862460 RepID=UPI001EE13201|nr:SDR family oxidoreductase [Dactylosporangium sp. AC04546]WVK87424.1 SDR family oxidoreductase [Dactylosporangium sp. AC04546]
MRNVVIYGAAGSIGSAVAGVFARQGDLVHLTGRTRETLEAAAEAIRADGGKAEVAVVDAYDEAAVEAHADSVGRIDVSLNLVPRGDVQGTPLVDMSVADFTRAVTNGATTNFITARAAAKRMAAQGGGVIIALNSGSSHGSPMMGSTGPTDAAIDTFVRNLAQEVGPQGVRVLGVWVAGIPETLTVEKLSAVNPAIDAAAVEGILAGLAQMRMLRRSPRLPEIAETIAFLASPHAAGMTGTFVNVTGMFTI